MIALLVIIFIICIFAYPGYGYNRTWRERRWGYFPFGGLGLIFLILVILLLLGRI